VLAGMVCALEQVDLSVDRLRVHGWADLARNRDRAAELAGRLGLPMDQAFHELGRSHWPEREVLARTARLVEEVRGFVAASGVVTLPDAAACHVLATPGFMPAGGAFMDAPGPFERPGLPAYFYVTLPDPNWPPPVRSDWLAKLNPWGMRNTTAHEAYPGHLLHFLRLAQLPGLRGAQDPGCLFYTLGKQMLLKLRADYQREAGSDYSPLRFHEELLACGAPPLPLARRMLLRAPAGDPL
jgi:uncharacterized protein (DUF885 family)